MDILKKLIAAGIPSPRLEAEMILETKAPEAEMLRMVERRLKGEPLDKILGYRDFYKHRFVVNNDVLSPRPDSEILVEEAIKIAKTDKITSILELGVGSGCLILSVIADVNNLKGVGVDKSPKALQVASQNAANLGLEDRVKLIEFDYFKDDLPEKFDMIISNPPYISSNDIATLDKEVREYDPLMALDGGADGLDHYKKIAEISGRWLNFGGYILLEAGIYQSGHIRHIFENQGFEFISAEKDLGGIERCIILRKNKKKICN